MAKVENCIRYKGKVYCWNSEAGQLEELNSKPISVSECPEIVVLDLMKLLDSKRNTSKE